MNVDSPYMLLVSKINSDKKIEMTSEQKNLFGIDTKYKEIRNTSSNSC